MYYQKLSCIYRFLPWNELHLTCHIAFCLTNKNDLLVETRRSKSVYSSGHSIIITVWTHIWLTSYPARTSMNFANLERTEKTRKQWHGCHVLLIFVKTLFTFGDWYPSRSKGVHLSRNSNKKSCNADNLGSITRHTANFGATTRHANNFCHPPNSGLWPDSIYALDIFFFAWSRLHIARASGAERTTVIRLKDDE